jgi:hypothetical protein
VNRNKLGVRNCWDSDGGEMEMMGKYVFCLRIGNKREMFFIAL